MSNELIPYRSNDLTARECRRLSRALNRQRTDTVVRIAGADAETDVALTKLDNYTMVVGEGMVSIARIGQVQQHCEAQAPELSGRLNYLAERHVVGVDALLTDFHRNLRRW